MMVWDVGFGHSHGFLFRPEGLIKISFARPPLVATTSSFRFEVGFAATRFESHILSQHATAGKRSLSGRQLRATRVKYQTSQVL
jgi:hypothetical protein